MNVWPSKSSDLTISRSITTTFRTSSPLKISKVKDSSQIGFNVDLWYFVWTVYPAHSRMTYGSETPSKSMGLRSLASITLTVRTEFSIIPYLFTTSVLIASYSWASYSVLILFSSSALILQASTVSWKNISTSIYPLQNSSLLFGQKRPFFLLWDSSIMVFVQIVENRINHFIVELRFFSLKS